MKKFLFLAMAAAAMVSCSQNEEIENAAQKAEIKLGAVVKSSTRAEIIESSGFKTFDVFAYTTTDKLAAGGAFNEFMNGITVTKDDTSGKWGYTDKTYYWPLSGYVQFFSVVPQQTLTVSTSYPKFEYTVGAIDDQKDLLAANLIDKDKSAGELKLPFCHLLTQVNFSIKGENGFTYTLTSLELVGVKEKGTFTFDGTNTAGSWGDQEALPSSTPYKYTGSVKLISTGANTVNLETAGNALFMLLPQKIDANAVTVKVTYSAEVTEGGQITADAVTKEIAIPAVTWEKGKRVRYTLILANDASSIAFGEPDWGDWSDATNPDDITPQ